jgi:hypothetical protein
VDLGNARQQQLELGLVEQRHQRARDQLVKPFEEGSLDQHDVANGNRPQPER